MSDLRLVSCICVLQANQMKENFQNQNVGFFFFPFFKEIFPWFNCTSESAYSSYFNLVAFIAVLAYVAIPNLWKKKKTNIGLKFNLGLDSTLLNAPSYD